jgi:hypothetical protein
MNDRLLKPTYHIHNKKKKLLILTFFFVISIKINDIKKQNINRLFIIGVSCNNVSGFRIK